MHRGVGVCRGAGSCVIEVGSRACTSCAIEGGLIRRGVMLLVQLRVN